MKLKRVTSSSNACIKEFRRARAKGDKILIEGEKLLREAMQAQLPLEYVVIADSRVNDLSHIVQTAVASGAECIQITDSLAARIGDVVTSQGLCALAPLHWQPSLDACCKIGNLAAVFDSVQNPGNVGTMLRSARAFGVRDVLFLPGCASPWSPKAVRASAGACFHLALYRADYSEAALHFARTHMPAIGLDAAASRPVSTLFQAGSCAIMIGNEGNGISTEGKEICTEFGRIPGADNMESLNAAVAASIAFYIASDRMNSRE